MSEGSHQDTLLKLFNSPKYADLVVIIDDGEEKQKYHLHRAIVCTASNYFDGLCEASASTKGTITLSVSGVTPTTFEIAARWIYGEKAVVSTDLGLNEFLTFYTRQPISI
ncbi:hypothetical protein TWF281_003725 [Arthrobotrys megalospora]